MTYSYLPDEYIKQLKAYNEQDSISFSPEDPKEYIVSRLKERAGAKRLISGVANTIVREYVENFEKDPEAITAADALVLDDFAEMLFPAGVRAGFLDAMDFGIYYRVVRLLAFYYKREGALNDYAIALSRCSAGFTILINVHTLDVRTQPYYEDALALARHPDFDSLSETARYKTLNALVNSIRVPEDEFSMDRLWDAFNVIRDKLLTPVNDYGKAVLYRFRDELLSMFLEHCIWAKKNGAEYDPEPARPLIAAADKLLQERTGSLLTNENPDAAASFLAVKLCLGDITLEEMLDGMDEIQRSAEQSQNPVIQLVGLAQVSSHYLNMLYYFSDAPKEDVIRRSREHVRVVTAKLVNISHMINNTAVNQSIVNFLCAASLTGSFNEFEQLILESTIYADKSLYIHTAMVREMSRSIFDYMIETTPEVFDGVAGHGADYIRDHRDEMKLLLSDCCMYHDIGKFFILDIVENSMRRLTDDEFSLIKEHPGNFEKIYQVSDDDDERVKCIRDCAMTHHLWHDGSKGYPKVNQTKNRPFADILAIADSIDAATDYIGRPYHSEKTLDQLIEEIQNDSGTRYGPEAAAVLSVPEVRDKLLYWITDGREEVNYQIYAFNRYKPEY